MSALSELLREIPLPRRGPTPHEACPDVEETTPSGALVPFSHRDEQIQSLAHHLFFRNEMGLVRHVGFAPIEPSEATAKLCLDLATLLAADGKYDVGLIEAASTEFPLAAQLNGPIPASLDTPWTIAPGLWMAPAESWWSHPGHRPVAGQNLQRLRDLFTKFHYEQVGHELARLGHEVTVYCRTYFTPPLDSYNGMGIRRLPTIRTKHLETVIHTLLSTLHAMAADFDVIHYHCLGPALFSFLPRLEGKKTVVTVQGLDWQRAKWGALAARILHLGEAAAVRLPNATMVVSHTLQQHYRDHYHHETTYIPNGATTTLRRAPIRLSKWDILPANYVLFLGRLSPEKNCHLLIEAFEKVPSDMKLVLAGGSSHSESYVENLRRHSSPRIRFLPWVSGEDLEELLSNAALFVLPSALEGLSLALLDAMAAGVCVLASDIPENREALEGTGYTFRSGDLSDLERMLDLLVHNPELRRQAVARQRQLIQARYQWPAIAQSIERVYHNVLGWPVGERASQVSAGTVHPALPAPGMN